MRGTLRWARADLRARRGQALVTVTVVAGVVAALFLASMLLQGAVNPWQQLFARTRGADVLVYFGSGTNTGELRYVAGIQAIAPPYQAASATLEQGAVRSQVELRAMTPQEPAMSAPLGMSRTGFTAQEFAADGLATGYRHGPDGWEELPFDPYGAFAPMGGVFSCVADLATWTNGFAAAFPPDGAASPSDKAVPEIPWMVAAVSAATPLPRHGRAS